jgi:competence protein ComEC
VCGCSFADFGALREEEPSIVDARSVEAVPADADDSDGSASDEGVADPEAEAAAEEGPQEPDPDESGAARPLDETLTVRFLDVGQGDAALISCGGQHLLIDGGPSDASQMIYAVLGNLGITRLDYIVLTHADSDHSGGVPAALQAATCGRFFCSVTTADNRAWASTVTRLDAQGVGIEVPCPGDTFFLGGATVTFLGPVTEALDSNNNSLVLRIDYGATSFLFTGDAEDAEESDLVYSGADLAADVLKVGHHGSKYSSTDSFLLRVSPTYAVVSVGENSYGHPTEEALSRLESCGAQVLRTDRGGTIVMDSDGVDIAVAQVADVTW